MLDDLRRYLRELAAAPFVWGELDCALAPAGWWVRRFGVDPADDLRGAYHDEATCAALLAAHGHLPRIFAARARRVGACRQHTARPGDVAVLRAPDRWFGAIATPSGRWAVKCGAGLSVTSALRTVAIWG